MTTETTNTGHNFKDDWPVKQRPENKLMRPPWGYMVNPENDYELIPVPEKIKYLEEALDKLDTNEHSYRQVADWLFANSEENISHTGLKKIWDRQRGHLDSPRAAHLKKLKYGMKNARQKDKNRKATQELAAVRRKITVAEKKKAKLEAQKAAKQARQEQIVGRKDKHITFDFELETTPEVEDRPKIFEPNPGPQAEFLASSEFEVLYGGAAGGGKSYAMLADPVRYFENPNFVGLLLRRTNDALRELKRESQKLYPQAIPGAKWKEKDSCWVFPSGAQLWMSYIDRDEDADRYQGQAFCWVGFDELTQYPTPYAWNYLRSRVRTSDPTLKPYLSMRATTNPGGPGHHWVKRMFIDPAPAGEAFVARDLETNEPMHDKEGKPLFYRKFIPAKLSDNPTLASDGTYERGLMSLPEHTRRKLLDGDWSVIEGAAFPEFNATVHVCKPFPIDGNWRIFRSCDYGYSSNTAVLWFAIDPSHGTLYVYRELYTRLRTGIQLAEDVIDIERKAGERVLYGVLDSSVWHQRGTTGPSVAEEMIGAGTRWRPADRSKGSRSAGKNRLHELLRVNEESGRPGIVIFDTCRQLLTDLPMIPTSPDASDDDIDDKYPNDHTYDALRYGIMSRPNPTSAFEDWITSRDTTGYKPVDSVFGY